MRPRLSIAIPPTASPTLSAFAFTLPRKELYASGIDEYGERDGCLEEKDSIGLTSGASSPNHSAYSGSSEPYSSFSASLPSFTSLSSSSSSSTSTSSTLTSSPSWPSYSPPSSTLQIQSAPKSARPCLRINTNIVGGEAVVGFCLSEDYDFDELALGMVEFDDDTLPSESCCEPGYPPGLVPVSARLPESDILSATDDQGKAEEV